jgi:hypothetical protein
MKIKAHDWEYGAVLHQIVMHPVFTSINKVGDKAGRYLVNEHTDLLIKWSGGDGPEWSFSFSPEDVEIATGYYAYAALNCGGETVCLLRPEQLSSIVDVDAKGLQQVKVGFRNNESMRVSGPLGNLDRTVPHNAFPADMLGRVLPEQEPHAWPELGRLKFYREPPDLVFSSSHRLLDVADNLGWRMDGNPITVYMGVSSISQKWPEWNEERLRQIESLVKEDLTHDGYRVKVQRHTPAVQADTKKKDRPCSDEFIWKLTITA